MADFDSPRVIVREKRNGTPQIRGSAKSIGGMVGRTLRGPLYAVRCDGPTKLTRIFGDDDPNSYLVTSAKKFFKNGGKTLYIQRVVGSSGGANTKASVTLKTAGGAPSSGELLSGANAFPVRLPAGTTFTGAVDGGGGVLVTVTATKAFRTGAGASYAAGAGGDSVTVLVPNANGGANQVIDLSAAGASQASQLAAFNNQLEGARAIDSAGQIRIETDQAGNGASGSIVAFGGAAAAKTGLSVGAFTAGTGNVANEDAVTAAEFVAMMVTIVGSTFTAVTATQVRWRSNTTGAGSSVQWTSGTGVALITGFDTVLHSGSASGAVDVMRWESIGPGSDNNGYAIRVVSNDSRLATGIPTLIPSGSITEAVLGATAARLLPGDTIRLQDTTTSTDARGVVKIVQGQKVVFQSAVVLSGNLTVANTQITLETFTATVLFNGSVVQGPRSALRVSSLSARNYFGKVFNIPNDEDAIVTTVDLGATGTFDLRPTNTDTVNGDAFTGGNEHTTFADADYIGSASAKTGFYGLDRKKDMRLIACPGVTGTVTGFVSKSLVEYATAREDCVAVIATPSGLTPSAAKTYKVDNFSASSYGAIYYPWPLAVGELSGLKEPCPPEGYVMGIIARTDDTVGIHFAPAGESNGLLVDAAGLETELEDGGETDLLNEVNINTILNVEDTGICVFGARTMENGEFNSLHIRRTFIYLRTSMKRGTRFAIFIPNDEGGRLKVENALDSFLYREWKFAGTLSGRTKEDAYSVQCNDDNNPEILQKQKRMKADVTVRVPETTENLFIEISQKQVAVPAAA